MGPDTLSVIVRSASFVALFQAAGMAIFLSMFGRALITAAPLLGQIARVSAIIAAVLLVGQYALEAARMADDFAGIADPAMQAIAMKSAASTVLALRLLGLGAIITTLSRADARITWSILGAAVIFGSFTLVGHSAAHPLRWALAPLLVTHVAIIAFWFGALVPLYLISGRESAEVAAHVTGAFSRIALWLVPVIFAAGVVMAFVLIRHLSEFRMAYGLSVVGKVTGFVLLMGLAALNKWRLGPALAAGRPAAFGTFRASLAFEYLLIVAVLSITAAMTTLYSPIP